MKYIIMADGKGSRWNNFMGHSKHDIRVEGETLLQRTVRLLHEQDSDAEVIITSHDPLLHIEGATRYEPQNNVLEVDRFTAELIGDDICFLYGDVLYSAEAISAVVSRRNEESVLFFGSEKSICAVLVRDGELFRSCYLKVREMFLNGEISECKGWQVYHIYAELPLMGREIGRGYVMLDSFTRDFNCPEDYLSYISES